MKGLPLCAWCFWQSAGLCAWPLCFVADLLYILAGVSGSVGEAFGAFCFRRSRLIVDEWAADFDDRERRAP